MPVAFAAAMLKPEAHTLRFVLSVLAIVPLAALLSHATESVAAKTGDAVGGRLKATNTLSMLGASFLLGGLKHPVQEFNRVSARMMAGLLFLATVALLIPSAVATADSSPQAAFNQSLSLGLCVLLILA